MKYGSIYSSGIIDSHQLFSGSYQDVIHFK